MKKNNDIVASHVSDFKSLHMLCPPHVEIAVFYSEDFKAENDWFFTFKASVGQTVQSPCPNHNVKLPKTQAGCVSVDK